MITTRRVAGAGVLGSVLLAATSPLSPARAADPIPIVDAFVIDVPIEDGAGTARFEGAIHGAYRIEEGTIVYWSLREAEGTQVGIQTALEYDDLDLIGGVLADPRAIDVLHPVHQKSGDCLCTTLDRLPEQIDSTRFQAMYTTFPALPAETSTIDIDVDGRGTVVVGVPVEDHLPAGEQIDAGSVPLGAGWPLAPDASTIRGAERTSPFDLVGRSSNLDGDVTKEGTGADRLVRFDADVLFDFDKDDLTPEAEEVVTKAVETLTEEGAGLVEIVGHTDAMGTAEYNDELSLRRARTVADVLEKELKDVEITVEGRGWDEPIASNETEEGRAKNRRVTIGYSAEGGR